MQFIADCNLYGASSSILMLPISSKLSAWNLELNADYMFNKCFQLHCAIHYRNLRFSVTISNSCHFPKRLLLIDLILKVTSSIFVAKSFKHSNGSTQIYESKTFSEWSRHWRSTTSVVIKKLQFLACQIRFLTRSKHW